MFRDRLDKRAFSLIELLVVLAIIGILAAMIFPEIGSALEKGRTANCQGNLKNFGPALEGFASDNSDYNDALPSIENSDGEVWDTQIQPYLGNNVEVYHCPSEKYLTSARIHERIL